AYSWNTTPAQNTATATNLPAGTWTCTVTDANACTTTRNVTITQPAAALALSGTVTPTTCGGAFNGAVDASINGGTAPYGTSWSGPGGFTSSATDISSLGSGVYILTVTDGNGCIASSNFNVGQPGLFSIASTTSDFNGFEVSCPSSTDGTIAQTLTGGTTPYTHAWTGPNGFSATTEDVVGLGVGTYNYILTDANGCSTAATYAMDAPPALSSALSSPTVTGGWNIGCNGASTGSIDAFVTGGVAPVATQWVGPGGFNASNEDITALSSGMYTLTLTDANGCTLSTPTTLTQASALTTTASVTTTVSCFGGDDGAAHVNASGGTAPYSYSWNTSPAQHTPNVTDLNAGTWTCTIMDINGCSTTRNIIVTQPTAALAVSITSHTDVLCHGEAEGSAVASAIGGTAPYSFVWNTAPAQAGTNATALFAGTYVVNVTDARGCIAASSVNILQPASPITAFVDEVTHETCFGAANGEATIAVSGGSGSYTITWDTQPTTNGTTATGLSPGLYTVEIIDNNGCSGSKHHPVTIQGSTAPLSYSLDISQVRCNASNDGSINLTLQGGHAPYSHIWTDAGGQQTGLEDLSALEPGIYTLNIVDFFGCALDTTVNITEPAALNTTGTITTAACQGSSTGAVDATVTGGSAPYSYAWSGPNGYTASTLDINALSAGTYDLTVTDANGCSLTTAFNVSQPGSLQVTATASNYPGGWGVSCASSSDGAIDLSVTGGTAPFTYQWTGTNAFTASTQDIAALSAGSYTATVSDANGCSLTLTQAITAPTSLTANATADVLGATNISCSGASDGAAHALVTGGTAPYDLVWAGPNGFTSANADPTGLLAGTYALDVQDANGCTTSTTVVLSEPLPLTTNSITPTSASGDAIACHGESTGQIELQVNGGTAPASIQWTGPDGYTATSALIQGLHAGTYSATISDANGCTTSSNVTLTEPTLFSASGIISDFNGSNTSCTDANDGSIDLTVTGGAGSNTFIWSGNTGFGATTEDVNSLEPGSYDVQVTDLNGCVTVADFILEAPQLITLAVTPSSHNGNNLSCTGADDAAIDLNISGGIGPYTISWSGPDGFTSNTEDISGLSEGNYQAIITDANGCSATAFTTLTAPTPIATNTVTSNFASGDQISCAGATDGAVDLTISGGTTPYTVAWTDGVGFTANTEDVSGLSAGFYQATITDANGCTVMLGTLLSAPTPIDLSAVLSNINGNNVTCDGATDGSIDITLSGGTAPYSILWNDGTTDEDRTNITAGTYSVTITDANACNIAPTYTLTAPATVTVNVTSATQPGGMGITCAGGTDGALDAEITGGTAPYSILWSGPNGFTAGTENITSLSAGNYDLVITDANGCTNTTTHVVSEPAPVQVTLSSITYNGGFNIPCATIGIGVFDATATGGTPGYDFLWSGPDGFTSTDEDLTSLIAGQYDLIVTDANGCEGSATASLTAPGPLDVVIEFSDFNGLPVSCAGNDGSIELTISGGTPAYQLDWTGPDGFGSQQEDLSGLGAGAYVLIVRDANGCEQDTTISLNAPDPLQAAFTNISNICGDAAMGSVDITMSGGGAPYSFSWNGPNGFISNSEDLSGVMNGQYSVVVNDDLNCTSTFVTTLNGPAPITSGTYVSFYGLYNLQCEGDSSGVIDLTPSGGVDPFSVVIAGPGGFTSSALQNNGLVAGDYVISITDINGCSMDTTVTLTQPNTSVTADLTISVYPSGTNVSCYGASDGSIDATVNGGNGPYMFSWRGPNDEELSATEDVSGLPAGEYNYELVVTDANQCNFFTTVMLTQPDTALYTTAITSVFSGYNTSCNGTSDGSIDLTIAGGNGGYTSSWSGPENFSSNAEDITDLIAGTYTATVTDINGCTVQQTVDIIAPEPILTGLTTSAFPGGSAISCAGANDGTIDATITGGAQPFTYAWSGPNGFTSSATDLTDLAAGTYCLSVTDANGCVAESCSTLEAPEPINALATSTAAACSAANGVVDLSVSGGSAPFTFQWNNGAQTEDLSGLVAGAFNVVITDANGCISNATATVSGSAALDVATSTQNVACFGMETGSVDLTVSSGTQPYTFAWSNGTSSEDLQNIAAGIYGVTVTDAAGCSFTNSFVIQQPTAIAIDTIISSYAEGFNVSGYGAHDGSITTAVSGGSAPYVFAWSNGATTESINGLPAGNYTLTVTDANGCSTMLTVTLAQATDLRMPTAFSPNGDGDNQYFVVRGLEGYPRNQLTVLNRWGNIVYEEPNYKNEWAGTSNQGDALPNGTYFIILSINDAERTLQGYVDLRR
ncbi:MAG: gliding motility-associated C-terminal domain-containing protein, partial [Flavobacteriales bacterium]|nr:gliding motility-associated C-terminal domain-containing protein [Flavobacteriales bacterium]